MKFLIVFALTVSLAAMISGSPQQGNRKRERTLSERNKFKAWRNNFKKQYANQTDEDAAMEKMLTNKEKIDAHNKLHEEGKISFRRGLWKHSDMSSEDKKKFLLGLSVPPTVRSAPVPSNLPVYPPGPSSVDWKAKGLVGPVMEQGWCGSCWAFSAAGVAESVLRRRNKTFSVSTQQMLDCSTNGCWGCSSGWPKFALDYLKCNGITDDDFYPYLGEQETCWYNKNMSEGYINATFEIPTQGNETLLRDIVASVGPVSIVMSIADSFYNYQSGVYYEKGCSMDINHAMLITGYGTDPVLGDYWMVKNSWGTSWGENGYVRFARNRGNNCNIAYYAVFAI